MTHRPFILSLFAGSLLGALVMTGCKVNKAEVEEKDRYFQEDPVHVEAAHENRLADEPSAFLRSRATDSIDWQPWGPELFEHALQEQKQIFALVTAGNYANDRAIKKELNQNQAVIKTLRSQYLCSLVDVHTHPEMGFLAFFLSSEVRRSVSFPMMIWFSHERSPIAWLPLASRDADSFEEVFRASHDMVSRIWRDDPRYVMKNSAADNDSRIERTRNMVRPPKDEYELLPEVEKAARAITALYDPTSREIDGAGGLVPFAMLRFAGRLAADPNISETLRKRLIDMQKGHLDLLLESAIYDPLDGGFFASRRTLGWSLPNFSKDSVTQLNAVLALVAAASISGEQRYLDTAAKVLRFAETRFGDEEGGIGPYESPAPEEIATKSFLWSLENLRELLPAEEFQVVEKCYGVTGLGNIPLESDPKRNFFRLNSLRHALSPQDAATGLGLPPERATELLESARQRLLVRRQESLEEAKQLVETTRIADLEARYAIALVELGNATKDDVVIARATKVLHELRKKNTSERGFMRIPEQGERRGVPARATDYAMALSAIFRVYRHDLDASHLVWAEELLGEVLEKLIDEEGLIREEPDDDRLLKSPCYNSSMIFGHATWGVICEPLERLRQLTGAEATEKLLSTITPRQVSGLQRISITHTDFAETALVIHSGTMVVLEGPKESAELKELHAVMREPSQESITVVHLDSALPSSFKLPEPSGKTRAIVVRGGKEVGEAATAEELRALVAGQAAE